MILLLLDRKLSYKDIGEKLDVVSHTIKKWKTRYMEEGLESLADKPRPGRERTKPEVEAKVCAVVQQPPPTGKSHWSSKDISKKTGVPRRTVSRILSRHNLKPHLQKSFMASNDPDFEEKAKDILELYHNPPKNAVVLCLDEKTQIQALDRLQPNLPVQPDRPERRTFEYKRNGITNLFAAFNIRTGKVTARCKKTRNQDDFIEFLDFLARQYGRKKEIHVVLDNLSTHKTKKVDEWMSRHPNWKFHFTPTYSSWLNQVEIWFSFITRQCIRRGVFHSVTRLTATIMKFVKGYNREAKPFNWSYNEPGRRFRFTQ